MSINELFTANEKSTTNARELNGTAALTSIATEVATNIIKAMEADIDNYRDRIATSAKDNSELDKLIDDFRPWCDIEEDHVLRHLSEETVESMLKSQQSKRSRSKSKAMTLDNYRTLMTAAIAESLLREIYNKPKAAGTFKRNTPLADLTPAQLEELASDQDRLRREIRNVQSKKSIMKSKADFNESNEAYQQLLKVEAMLKDLRDGANVVEVDHTKDALSDLLDGIDFDNLKAADSKELLMRISELRR